MAGFAAREVIRVECSTKGGTLLYDGQTCILGPSYAGELGYLSLAQPHCTSSRPQKAIIVYLPCELAARSSSQCSMKSLYSRLRDILQQ